MKVLAGLLALVAVTSAVSEVYRKDNQYEYQYKAHSLTGIPLISNDRSGLSLWTKVQLYFLTEDQVVMQLVKPEMRQVSLEQLDQHVPMTRVPELHEIEGDHQYTELPADIQVQLKEYLERPIKFTINRPSGGLVRDVLDREDTPEWALNIKMAILNKLQLQRVQQVEKKQENTIIGEECEVSYDIIRDEQTENVKHITKEYSHERCATPSSFRDVIGIQGHLSERNDDIIRSSFVSRANVTDINNRYFVNHVVSEGRITLRPFSPEDGEIVTYSRQELEFIGKVSKSIRVPTEVVKRSESLFTHMQTKDNQFSDVYTDIYSETQKIELIKKLLEESVEKMETETEPELNVETTQELVHAIKLMRSLRNKNSFVQLVKYFFTQQRQQMRPMFVSCLSFCGSPALVEALPELRHELRTTEANQIITSLPATQVPTKNTIDILKKLYNDVEEESTCRQLLLVLGTQVHDLCKPVMEGQFRSSSQCKEDTIKNVREFLEQEYKKTTDETRKLIVLKAIGNSGLDMTEFLQKLIVEQTIPTELRENAIYALRRVVNREDIQKILIPVFRNEKNLYPVEMRIAAFNILIERLPTEQMLKTLVASLNEEENRQLGNYIYSYLDNLINLPTFYQPTKNLTIAAQTLLPTLQRFEDGIWFSKNIQYVIASMSRRFALFIESNMVNTPSQSLPRGANFKLAKYFAGFYTEILEFGFRMEGLDQLFKEYIQYLEPNTDLINILAGGRFKREVAHMKSMLSESDVVEKPVEQTRGYIFVKHLGNEIGVFTTKDYTLSEIKEHLMTLTTWESNLRYFNILPIAQATIKVQSLVGMPVVADWNMVSVLSLRSLQREQTQNTIVSRSYSPRFLIQSFARAGVDMGLFKTTSGQRMHVTLATPVELRVQKEEGKIEFEAWISTKSQQLKKTELLVIEAMPVIMTEVMQVKDIKYECKARELVISQLQTPFLYEMEYEGLRLTVESHQIPDFTKKLPVYPFCGRHHIRVEFVKEPKPMGVKVELKYVKEQQTHETYPQYTYTGLFTVNPRIESLKMELSTILSIKMEDNKRPLISVEVEPKWRSGVYRLFTTIELLEGEINPAFSWLEATEDKPIEYTIKAQWGKDKQYSKQTEDLVIKSVIKKSDLQKLFETEDELIEDSDCFKCEQEKNTFRTIYCDRCIYKRSWLSQIVSKVFINKEKLSDLEYNLMPLFAYYAYPYYSWTESQMRTERNIHSSLINSVPSLREHMKQVSDSDLYAYEIIHDVHPYFTEQNVTVLYKDQKLVFTHIPLIPAWRRMYNLPLNRLTDVATDRLTLPSYGKCIIDELNKCQTLDNVVYHLPKDKENCEQLLVKDVTRDQPLEITTTEMPQNRRSLKVVFGDNVVEIKPESSTWTVLVNNKPIKFENDVVRSGEVRVERVEITTPQKTKQRKIILTLESKMIKCEIIDRLVSVQLPFWYKNQLVGLCGDFNGERVHEMKLPNQKLAPTLEQYIRAYSAPTCTIHQRA